jgi:hypothetical protein
LIGILCGTLAIGTVTVGGCNATQVQADIQKVIALLPTAVQIAGSILNIVAAAEGNSAPSSALLATVQNASGQIRTDLTLANSLVAQYQTDLASAPAGVLGKIDAAFEAAGSPLLNPSANVWRITPRDLLLSMQLTPVC